ncbi:MAG: VanZ family protein [Calditrichaceae bacterium]|nr:VanZ family protein [Calditrichaceae bacterium]
MKLRHINAHAPWILVMIAITIESSISNISLPDMGITFTDKLAHFMVFAIMGWTLTRGMLLSKIKYPIIIAVVIGFIFAVTDEWHQSFVPGRDADVIDVIADLFGLIVSANLYKLFIRYFPPKFFKAKEETAD